MGFMLPVSLMYKSTDAKCECTHYKLSAYVAMAMKNTSCSPDTFACALTTSGERKLRLSKHTHTHTHSILARISQQKGGIASVNDFS